MLWKYCLEGYGELRGVLRSVLRGIGAAIITCLMMGRWFKEAVWIPAAEFWIDSIMGSGEESLKSLIREVFAFCTRIVNGFFSWVVAALPKEPLGRVLSTKKSRAHAWQGWWAEHRPSTFNAIIARDRPPAVLTSKSSPQRMRLQHPGQEDTGSLLGRISAAAIRVVGATWSSICTLVRKMPGWQKLSRQAGSTARQAGKIRRRGSDLFDRPSGVGMSERSDRRGFVEELCLRCEIAVTAAFDTARWLVRAILRVPATKPPTVSAGARMGMERSGSGGISVGTSPRRSGGPLRRSLSFSSYEALHGVSTALDVIRNAGYPVEPHIVTTSDGYILQMERIPRKGARDVVFFMHGILDTSMGWVCNGVTGSSAFAAFDAGFDVWLGNSRANPPRLHKDPQKQGAAYWHYSVNELGMEDVAAQVDHIHVIKTMELTAGTVRSDGSHVTRGTATAAIDSARRASFEASALNGVRRSHSEMTFRQSDFQTGAMPCQEFAGEILKLPNKEAIRAANRHRGGSEPRELHADVARRNDNYESSSPCTGKHDGENSASNNQQQDSPNSHVDDERGFRTDPSTSPCRDDAKASTSVDSESVQGQRCFERGDVKEFSTMHDPELYRLRAVGHSLGGAALLIYATMCCRAGRPHHLYRLILLTPAGILKKAPWAMWPLRIFVPPLSRLLQLMWPGVGTAAYVPSSLLRWLTFKVLVDLQQIPALNQLTVTGLRMVMNGDSSQWDKALQMPHYNSRAMPAISFHTGVHLVQWASSGCFTLFDYGSRATNREHYGQDTPLDVMEEYGSLHCPVDICAGRADGIIAKENVVVHYEAFKTAGARVTFREFDFGHLDFTFGVKDELRHFVLSRLLQRN